MGTNYYTKGHPDRFTRHLGKSSVGWKFGFYAPPEWGREKAYTVWKAMLIADLDQGAHIEDEYGRTVSEKELLELIEIKQGHRSHLDDRPDERAAWVERGMTDLYDHLQSNHFDSDGYDFCDGEFS
jgi:hypothetical protein